MDIESSGQFLSPTSAVLFSFSHRTNVGSFQHGLNTVHYHCKPNFNKFQYLHLFRNEEVQMTWKGDNFDELKDQLDQHINEQHATIDSSGNKGVEHGANKSKADNHTKTAKQERNVNKSGANNKNERTSASRKTDSLKRQGAVEKRAEIDRQNKTSEGPKSQKSQACNIL